MSTEMTPHNVTTALNMDFYNCINTSINSTDDVLGTTLPMMNTLLQSTMAPIAFNNLTDCSDTVTDSPTPRDSLRNYLAYVIGHYMNRSKRYVIVGFGLPGNILALITIWKMTILGSTGIYMGSLAFLDSLYLVITLLYFSLNVYDVQLYNAGCKLFLYFGHMTMQFSNCVLAAMTIERVLVIWFPFKASSICTKKKALAVVAGIGIVLMSMNLVSFWTWHQVYDPVVKYMCVYQKKYKFFMQKIWYWMDSVAYCFAPLIVIIVSNILIVFGMTRVSKTQKQMTNNQSNAKQQQQSQIARMSITVSVVFLFLTTPKCVMLIYQFYWDRSTYPEYAKFFLIYQISFIMSDINHAINFYLYFLSGRKFRKSFKSIFCRCSKEESKSRNKASNISSSNSNTAKTSTEPKIATVTESVSSTAAKYRIGSQ